jgi:anti-sigma factor RsiW
MPPVCRWAELLSPCLDGELDLGTRGQLEAHLAGCAACREMLEDLRAIVSAAPSYRGVAPQRDLWPAIATGIDRSRVVPLRPPVAPTRFTLRQLVAASVLLAAGAGGLAWSAGRQPSSGPATVQAVGLPPVPPSPQLAAVAPRADSAYHGAVADLEAVLAAGRGRLDTATVRVIEQSLDVIDRAIAEAEAAIAADPANVYLNSQVAANMRRKLDLLRRTTAAIQASAS